MNAQDIAQRLHEALVLKAKRELVMSKTEEDIYDLTMKLYDALELEAIDHVAIKDEITQEVIEYKQHIEQDFSLIKEETGTDKFDDYEGFFNWLKTVGLGDIIKMKASVHAATRKKVLKEFITGGGVLPEWIKERFFNTIKSNGAGIKRIAAARL